MKLSVIVPSLTGEVPQSLRAQVLAYADVEIVAVKGISPVGRARNEGLDRAKGDYIAWVDGDDEVTDDWLDTVLDALSAEPDAVIIGHRWEVAGDAGPIKIWRGEDLLGDVLRQETIFGELWTKILRHELWDGGHAQGGVRLARVERACP